MRVALAAVLFAEPDLLLLDEPTNYLDLEGTLWLESYLARYPRSVLLISHDRDLLNRAVDGIVHLAEGKLVYYRGGYDQFDRQRRERQALQLKMRKKQEDQRRHMEAFVERFRYKASKARQAQSRLKALAKLEPVAAIADDTILPFTFRGPARPMAPPIVAMEGVEVGYDPGRIRSFAGSTCASTTTTASPFSARTATASRPSPSCSLAGSSLPPVASSGRTISTSPISPSTSSTN